MKMLLKILLGTLLVLFLNRCNNGMDNSLNEDCGTNLEVFSPTDTVGTVFLITGVRILPLERTPDLASFFSPKLHYRFEFSVEAEWKKIDSTEAAAIHDPRPINFPDEGLILNHIETGFDTSRAVLKFNKDITYKGRVIPAGTDIINLIGVNYKEMLFPWTMAFGFEPILFNQADFKAEKGCYQMIVWWKTSMNQTLSDTVNVFLDLTDTPAPIFTNSPGSAFGNLKEHPFSLFKVDALKSRKDTR